MEWDDTTIIQPTDQLLYITVYSLLSDMCGQVVEQELTEEVKLLSSALAEKEEELIGMRLALAAMNELPSPSPTRARIGEHAARMLEEELAGMSSEHKPRTRTRGSIGVSEHKPRTRTRGSIGVEQATETDGGLSVKQVRRLGKDLIHEVFVKAKGSKAKALQLLGYLNVMPEIQMLREGALCRKGRSDLAKQEIVQYVRTFKAAVAYYLHGMQLRYYTKAIWSARSSACAN